MRKIFNGFLIIASVLIIGITLSGCSANQDLGASGVPSGGGSSGVPSGPTLLKMNDNGVVSFINSGYELGTSTNKILGGTYNKLYIDTLAVTVASSVIGHTDITATSNTTSTLSVIQGGSGDVLSLYSAGSEIFSVLSNGNIVLESGDTIKNDTASTTVLSGKVGIGSSTPQAVLSVSSPIQSSTNLFQISSTTAASLLLVDYRGNVGIGTNSIVAGGLFQIDNNSDTVTNRVYVTSDAASQLRIQGDDDNDGTADSDATILFRLHADGGDNNFTIGLDDSDSDKFKIVAHDSLAGTDQFLTITGTGNIGISTSSPDSLLSVTTLAQANKTTRLLTVASTTGDILFQTLGDGTIRLGDGTGAGNAFSWNTASSAVNVFSDMYIGQLGAENVSGLFTMYNSHLSGGLAQGTDVGYSLSIGNTPILTVFAEADGNGYQGIQNQRIGIGTTTPDALLSASSTDQVVALFDQRGTLDILQVKDAGVTRLVVKDGGNVGIGTSSPSSLVDIYDSTATSTMFIYSGGAGLGGRIIVEDNGGTACTEIWTDAGNIRSGVITCPY